VFSDDETSCVQQAGQVSFDNSLFVADPAFQIMDKTDISKVERYLRRVFNNTAIKVTARPKKTDSAEVYIGEEFVGVLFEDIDEGEKSYNFQMGILEMDLEDA
jgi:Protein of unknown function (DUF3126)